MYVKTGKGKFFVDLPSSTTLDSLKQGIAEQHGIPPEEQKLFFGGKQLVDGTRSLTDYNILPTNTLLLIQQTNLQKNINVFIRTLKEDYEFKLLMTLSDNVGRIRNLLQERFPLPSGTMIVYKGVTLSDDRKLIDYDIKDNSVIYIVSKVVVEVENSSGERIQMSITDPEITGEIVEKLTQRERHLRDGGRKRSKRSREEVTSEPLKKVQKQVFGGLRKGFLHSKPTPPTRQPSSTLRLEPIETNVEIEVEKKLTGDGTTRCNKCNKKVGLTAIKCRCGSTFCAAHRYAEAHGCTYDYKANCRQELTKQNPKIVGEKLTKIL